MNPLKNFKSQSWLLVGTVYTQLVLFQFKASGGFIFNFGSLGPKSLAPILPRRLSANRATPHRRPVTKILTRGGLLYRKKWPTGGHEL